MPDLRIHQTLMWLACFCVITAAARAEETVAFDEGTLEFFEKEVRPILAAKCFECHAGGDREPKGGLRLDSREAVLRGGDTGPAVEMDKPAKSLFLSAINYGDVYQMPPKSKLSASEIATLTKWVDLKLPWPKETASDTGTVKPFNLVQRASEHWCWRGITDGALPPVADAGWPLSEADRFVLAKLETKGVKPAAPAEKRTLLRRVYFDLIGLPPTPEEVAEFLQDNDPRALERVVDKLLGSVHFGERWGRHWLDLVRYAETRGHEFEPIIPNAWQYRDYVIRALNDDVPFDRFLVEHLAGDLIEPRWRTSTSATASNTPPVNEAPLGTGFWFLGEEVHSPVDIRKDETDRMDNRLDVMSKTFLGLTVACARCHDHKFDAISQRDYYALAGFAISGSYRQMRVDTAEQHRQIAIQLDEARRKARHESARSITETTRSALEKLDQYWLVAKQILEAESQAAKAGQNGATSPEQLQRLAADQSLDAALLTRWCAEFRSARGDANHPLHALFELKASETSAPPALSPANLVVDFGDPNSNSSIQDGVSFGLRPVKRGQLMLRGSAETPVAEVATVGGWERDLFWKNITLTPQTEFDHGTLGAWKPYGRMVRSPEFTLTARRAWCLVRGSVHAYAVVNSHLIIAGPLHNGLLREFKHADDQWHWVAHDLDLYQGHRLHLEFSPADDGPCTIAMVVQSDSAPPLPSTTGISLSAAAAPSSTIDQQVVAYAKAFRETVQTVLGDDSGCHGVGVLDKAVLSSAATDAARNLCQSNALLANWFVTHPQLFTEGQADRRLVASQETVAALSRQVQWESGLAPAMLDGNGVDEFLLVRGNSNTPKEPVSRRFLEAFHVDFGADAGRLDGLSTDRDLTKVSIVAGTGQLSPRPESIEAASPNAHESAGPVRGSGRLELAHAMLHSPLASRVAVNRIWHHLFGRGIVPSVDNFGVLGLPPSHPELLDHLSAQFAREGWSTKRMIRSLILSRTYQMSSLPTDGDAVDPNNELWHRMPIKRLQGEAIRDSLLAVSGRLDRTTHGPSVPIHLTEFMQGRGRPGASGPLDGNGRRSIYIAIRRNFLSPMMLAFDTPSPFSTVGRRTVSNVPAQALILMNDPFVVEESRRWAARLLALPSLSTLQRIEQMYLMAFSRLPSAEEAEDAASFLKALDADRPESQSEAWTNLCHVMFNVKEFVFVE